MKKYKKSIKRIYFFNRWGMEFPPDDWCMIGISQW